MSTTLVAARGALGSALAPGNALALGTGQGSVGVATSAGGQGFAAVCPLPRSALRSAGDLLGSAAGEWVHNPGSTVAVKVGTQKIARQLVGFVSPDGAIFEHHADYDLG